MNDFSDQRIPEGTRGEDAIDRTFSTAGMAERTERGGGILTVRTMKLGFSGKVFCAMRAEKGTLRFAGEAVEGKKEIKEMLDDKHNFE